MEDYCLEGLWPLVSVLIALHMDDISALFPARSVKYFLGQGRNCWQLVKYALPCYILTYSRL